MAVVLHPALNRPAAPRVSVCIANFNGEYMLGDCIESILSQDTDVDVEIVVHDQRHDLTRLQRGEGVLRAGHAAAPCAHAV